MDVDGHKGLAPAALGNIYLVDIAGYDIANHPPPPWQAGWQPYGRTEGNRTL